MATFNDTYVQIPFVPVHMQIRRMSETHPEKKAVICDGKSITFKELDRLSDRLARVIMQKQKK